MANATYSFQVEEELQAAFQEATKSQHRSDVAVLRDFMLSYVQEQQNAADYDRWFRRKVQAAVRSANAMELISHDDVEAEFAALREQARKSSAR